ncbi:hypothetical protein GGR52DRAFT_540695 [Hypoxylon sp. FL1284]|nr:hypothetical protein GGR52DRAFT_540695 [Hypoxylon sp. FL1284]
MAEEIRRTPVPVPHVYGQASNSNSGEASAPALTVEQPSAGDVTMSTAPTVPAPSTEQAASPAPAASTAASNLATSNAPSPAAAAANTARNGTPLRNMNGQDNTNGSSRAASQHPDSGFTMPAEAPPHGAPVRQYLNTTVTVPLLDGMKMIAKDRPKDPLRVLGEYLIQRSKELEASSST